MPCYDAQSDYEDEQRLKTLEEQLCDARDLIVKLKNQQELTKKEVTRLNSHIEEHLKHRSNERLHRIGEIDHQIIKIKERIGFVLDNKVKFNELLIKKSNLEDELKRLKSLTDEDLLSDRFCDRIRV